MSYFVFGLVDAAAADVTPVRKAAANEGMHVNLGAEVRQPIVLEMVGAYDAATSVPFLLARSPADDTSDALISPHVVGLARVGQACGAIGRWLAATLQVPGVARVQLWMTEGFEVSFESLALSAADVGDELSRRVAAAGDVPSLHVTVVG